MAPVEQSEEERRAEARGRKLSTWVFAVVVVVVGLMALMVWMGWRL